MRKKLVTNSLPLKFMISSATLRMQFWQGGIRRAALISLFSADDEDMLGAKAGALVGAQPSTRTSKQLRSYNETQNRP